MRAKQKGLLHDTTESTVNEEGTVIPKPLTADEEYIADKGIVPFLCRVEMWCARTYFTWGINIYDT